MSCDNEATRGFWPLLPGHLKVDFGDATALEKIFKGLQIFYYAMSQKKQLSSRVFRDTYPLQLFNTKFSIVGDVNDPFYFMMTRERGSNCWFSV